MTTPRPRPGPDRGRPRDAAGRALNDRPRDALGRPLPRGAAGVPRQPEGIARTPEETLRLGQALLDERRPFHAHDVFEDHWKHTAGPERRLWRGLAQLAVGITHAARGNARGAAAVLRRAAGSLEPFTAVPPHGIDVGGVREWALRQAGRIESAETDDAAAAPLWLDAPRLHTPSGPGR